MRKRFSGWLLVCLLVCLLLFSAAPAFALGKLQGYVGQGGADVVTKLTGSTIKAQRTYPNAQVTVYLAGTTTIATIYSDSSLTAKSNPFTADSTAFWFFYAADGDYDVRFSGGGIATPWTVSGWRIVSSSQLFISAADFGVSPSSSAAANDAGILSAIAAAKSAGKAVMLPAGTLNTSASVTVDHVEVDGTPWVTIIKPSAAVTRAVVVNEKGIVRGIYIDGTNTTNAVGIFIGSDALDNLMLVDNCQVFNFLGATAYGIRVYNAVGTTIRNTYSSSNNVGIYLAGSGALALPTTTSVYDSQFRSSTTHGALLALTYNTVFGPNCVFENNTQSGMNITPLAGGGIVQNTTVEQAWFEGNYAANTAQFQLDANGASDTIEELQVRDTFFAGNGGTKAIRLNTVAYYSLEGGKIADASAGTVSIVGVNAQGWMRGLRGAATANTMVALSGGAVAPKNKRYDDLFGQQGANLTVVGGAITIDSLVHNVGAGLFDTINVAGTTGAINPGFQVTLIPTDPAGFTTAITGNIRIASTGVQYKAMTFTWDGTKWCPSY